MNKQEEIEVLVKELIELLKEGNISLQEVYEDYSVLMNHPDLDKAIDVLAALEDLLWNNS